MRAIESLYSICHIGFQTWMEMYMFMINMVYHLQSLVVKTLHFQALSWTNWLLIFCCFELHVLVLIKLHMKTKEFWRLINCFSQFTYSFDYLVGILKKILLLNIKYEGHEGIIFLFFIFISEMKRYENLMIKLSRLHNYVISSLSQIR